MKKALKLLITSAFSHPSKGLIRSLRVSQKYKDIQIIGTDTMKHYHGYYEKLPNLVIKVPPYYESGYNEIINNIMIQEEIDAAMIIHELEVQFWAKNGGLKCKYLIPNLNFADICLSKGKLYNVLKDTTYIPQFCVLTKDYIEVAKFMQFPLWVRNITPGTGGGKGAHLLMSKDKLMAWNTLYEPRGDMMFSEYLPGRNLASLLIIKNNTLLHAGNYERIDYLLKHASQTGVTGQISKGKLLNEPKLTALSMEIVLALSAILNESISGFITLDYKEDFNGNPKLTEINLRPVSPVYAFAQAGFNMSEFYLDAIMDDESVKSPISINFPTDNVILREVDGLPIWIANHQELV